MKILSVLTPYAGLIILGAVVLALVLFLFGTYNSLVKLRNLVEEAFATMDVYLKKRWDLIPNLVETVKGYAKHESGALQSIIQARSAAYTGMSNEEKLETNRQLTSGLARLMAVAEQYPDLKANQNFMDLSRQLASIETDIANSRKYYNAVVRQMNNAVQVFPKNIVAGLFGFKKMQMFEAAETERENVRVEF
jgi:LemA protein